MKSAIPGDVGNGLHFVRSPFGRPRDGAVVVVDIHAGNVYAFDVAPLSEHRIFGNAAWSKFSEIVLYIDPSFKGSTKNDFKAAKLWGKAGNLSGFFRLSPIIGS